MYSINGTYIKTKNNIIEHMQNIPGMVSIDKDAIAAENLITVARVKKVII